MVKNSPVNAGDAGLIPGFGRSLASKQFFLLNVLSFHQIDQ